MSFVFHPTPADFVRPTLPLQGRVKSAAESCKA